ncbi:MAG: hypothetical protein WBX25_21300 [Rhodomicrobium sp.]
MSLPDISFENIRPHEGSRHTGFEELCAQLASLEPYPREAIFVRKGRGADAGIECYFRLANGQEIGWQAKFLFAWDTNLVSQLDKSLRTALDKHPKLTNYIVCLPFNLPDARPAKGQSAQQKWEAWKAKWEQTASAENRTLTITLWDKTAIGLRLTNQDAANAGRLLYWFGEEALTPAWFERQFEKARLALGSRYTPDTNVELPIRKTFLAVAREPHLQVQVDHWYVQVHDRGLAAVRAIRQAVAQPAEDPYSSLLEDAIDAFVTLLGCDPTGPERAFTITEWLTSVTRCIELTRSAFHWAFDLPPGKTSTIGISPERWAQENLRKFLNLLTDIRESLLSDPWQLVNAPAVLLTGPAGVGKSHLLADVVEHQIHKGRPAIMVLGSLLIDGEPWRQIMAELDLPATQQVKHFLASLDAAAQASGSRALICVDALNERYGTDIWPSRLAAFLKAAEPFRRICVVLSCRSTYLSHVTLRRSKDRIFSTSSTMDSGPKVVKPQDTIWISAALFGRELPILFPSFKIRSF